MTLGRRIPLAMAIGLLLAGRLAAQDTPQVTDDKYALGNAPYSNAAPANHQPVLPFDPVGFETPARPFGPAAISDYGNGPKARVGFFFSYERLGWFISRPQTTDVGSQAAEGFYTIDTTDVLDPADNGGPIQVLETNSVTTDFLNSNLAWGNRFDFGYMDVNDYGWLVSIIDHVNYNQTARLPGDSTVLFDNPRGLLDPAYQDGNVDGIDDDMNGNDLYGRDDFDTDRPRDGIPDTPIVVQNPNPPPDQFRLIDPFDQRPYIPRYRTLEVTNRIRLNGVEVMRIHRSRQLHFGGYFECLYGVRFFQIDDNFHLIGTGGVLADTDINMTAMNNIIGPQIGGRWTHQRGRWIFSAEGRFTAGVNFQNLKQHTVAATQFGVIRADGTWYEPQNGLRAFDVSQKEQGEEFAPLAELRVQTVYQFTRSVALKLGYTGLFVSGISRASNRIHYSVPDMGFIGDPRQEMWSNGFSVGVEVNR